jgi:capsule polysaccharide export protein KpsE/RkpR
MKPDPALLADLRDAIRQATRDLETLKTIKTDEAPKVRQLLKEMRSALFKDCGRVAKEARSESSKARNSSAQHVIDLVEIKRRARRAAELLQQAKLRQVPSR